MFFARVLSVVLCRWRPSRILVIWQCFKVFDLSISARLWPQEHYHMVAHTAYDVWCCPCIAFLFDLDSPDVTLLHVQQKWFNSTYWNYFQCNVVGYASAVSMPLGISSHRPRSAHWFQSLCLARRLSVTTYQGATLLPCQHHCMPYYIHSLPEGLAWCVHYPVGGFGVCYGSYPHRMTITLRTTKCERLEEHTSCESSVW